MTASLVVLVIVLACANPVSATLYQVTTLADGNDGTCDAHCTLREAIVAANSYPGLDYITIPAGTVTLTDPAGCLEIWEAVFITGQGKETTIIDASGLGDRVFDVTAPGDTVSMTSLTITGGMTMGSGGGIALGGGHLVLSAVVVRDNSTVGSGGGIYAGYNQLTVKDGSEIIRNSAGEFWYGGGIKCDDLTITDSIVSENSAGTGGGISCSGTLTISESTIADNTSLGYDGGGLHLENSATADISNTTIAGNHSGRLGGAIYASLFVNVSLNAVTVSGNSAVSGASLHAADSTIALTNTLITGICLDDGSGGFVSNGGNLEWPSDSCGLVPGMDLIGVGDPMLGPLTNNGGPTPTMLPQPGSPALGAGDNLYCLSEDQRGELRSDGYCDIGAVERQPFEPEPIFSDGFESGATSAWS